MYELTQPSGALSPFIDRYWMVRSAPAASYSLSVDVYVDGQADLVINFGAPYRRVSAAGAVTEVPDSVVDAQRTRPMVIRQEGVVSLVGVRFAPGGLAAFSPVGMADLTDRVVPMASVLGPDTAHLSGVLEAAPTLEARAAALNAFFEGHRVHAESYELLRRVLAGLQAATDTPTVARVAREAGVSPRTLHRVFAHHVGLTPKFYLRVHRFQRALRRMMADPDVELGTVAAEFGFYDQSHLVREFRALAGGVPRGYRGYLPATGSDFAPNVVRYDGAPNSTAGDPARPGGPSSP